MKKTTVIPTLQMEKWRQERSGKYIFAQWNGN